MKTFLFKKILFGIGVVFVLLILIGIIFPTSDSEISKREIKNVEVDTRVAISNLKEQEAVVPKVQNLSPKVEATKETVAQVKIPPAVPTYTYYSVTSVVDGDTLKVNINGNTETLRLIGMDTPETVDPRKPVQCFGKEASNKAKELLTGKKVRIEKDPTQGERDKYNRLLAYIYREDGLFYNKYMIEIGYAHEYTYGTPYKYQAEFKVAQRSAQASFAGLWSPNTCNGDTTSSAGTTTVAPVTQTTQTVGKFYTSSYSTSKYYYPAECDDWKSLSVTYLKSFDSLDALLLAYPSKAKSPQCD
ncbi:MAG: thermonuclease family protein [Candidatus Paceibacterota bacterium]|jgi:endonuclease YncB( thermonuclease family)